MSEYKRMDIIGQNGNTGEHYITTDGSPHKVDMKTKLPEMRPEYYDLPPRLEDLVKHMPMFHGNATKYIVRAGKKTTGCLEDLKKARECLDIEIERLS